MNSKCKTFKLIQLDCEIIIKSIKPVKNENGNWVATFPLIEETSMRNATDFCGEFPDNEFFRQVRKAKEKQVINAKKENPEYKDDFNAKKSECMRDSIIYLNFKSVFPREINNELKKIKKIKERFQADPESLSEEEIKIAPDYIKACLLLRNGFSVEYKNGKTIEYVPIDKSNSMSRESRIIYIDKTLYDAVNIAVMLGFKLYEEEILIKLSNYYAYRGLYLTNAIRIEDSLLKLDEESVIVIPDCSDKLICKDTGVYTAKKTGNTWSPKNEKEGYKIEITRYDGEGLICPEYAEIISDYLYKDKEKASSFQIRLPYTKGMLHKVDFHKFFKEEVINTIYNKDGGSEEDVESIYKEMVVEDVFGQKRKISEAKIILTESMFKCLKWYRKVWDKNKNDYTEKDPMELFFKRVKEYDYGLCVVNTDAGIKCDSVKLNYQFLNTLALSGQDFKDIIDEHVEEALNLLKDENKAKALEVLLGPDPGDGDVPEDEMSDEYIISFSENTWKAALRKNHDFIDHQKIKNELAGIVSSKIIDVAYGRVSVSGKLLFLSQDLMSFLYYLTKLLGDSIKDKDQEKYKVVKNKLKEYCLGSGLFYAPDVEEEGNYGLLRNPHLSRNEQCVLKAYIPGSGEGENVDQQSRKTKLYKKYFSHLRGVVMLPYNSYDALILGGADYDGDMIKLIFNDKINTAMEEGCYKLNEKGKKLERKLPIVIIPDTKIEGIEKRIPEKVDYKTIQNTFSSAVGLISNKAISAPEWSDDDSENDHSNDVYPRAYYTILTGLEIDAAKTGVHPDLPETQTKKSVFLEDKKYFDEFRKMDKSVQENYKVVIDKNEIVFCQQKKKKKVEKENSDDEQDENINEKRFDLIGRGLSLNIKKDDIVPDSGRDQDNINYLAIYFLMAWKKYKEKGKEDKKDKKVYFDFHHKEKKNTERDKECKELYDAYKEINDKLNWFFHRAEAKKKISYLGKIYTLMKFRCGDASTELVCEDIGLEENTDKITVDSYIAKVYFDLQDIFEYADKSSEKAALEKVKGTIKKLSEDYWHFTGYQHTDKKDKEQERKNVLREILPDSKDKKPDYKPLETMFSNFDNQGYYLLYYFLMDIRDRLEEVAPIDNEDVNRRNKRNMSDNKYYNDFINILVEKFNAKQSKSMIRKSIHKEIRCKLKEIFGDESMEEAIRYCYGVNSSGPFFWETFTTKEILSQIHKKIVFKIGGENA